MCDRAQRPGAGLREGSKKEWDWSELWRPGVALGNELPLVDFFVFGFHV